jgi:transcriptional regulator with XRE-family HTH domain
MTTPDTINPIQKRCNTRLRALRSEVGTKIHSLRLSRRMTLHKLSSASGLGVPLLDLIECGRGELNLYHIIALAQAFKVPETYFVGEAS